LLSIRSIPPDVEIQRKLTYLRIDVWLREDVFHFRWWFLLIVFILSAFFWWKKVEKARLYEIILYAALVIIITLGLDEIGEELCLWDYPTDVVPVFPPLTAINLASLPMIYSLIYQRFKTWKSFIWATLIMAAIFCFVFEPILVWGGFYQTLKWKYYYGFPIYTAMALCIKLAVTKIFAVVDEAKKHYRS
jgi:hypothetical protein